MYGSVQAFAGSVESGSGALSAAELQYVIDNIPVLVVRCRPDGRIDFGNRTWRSYTGLSDESAETAVIDIAHPEDRAPAQDWRGHLRSGVAFKTEQRLRRHDGEYRWHSIRCEPLHDDSGHLVAWYGAGYDIEDGRRAEAAMRRSECELADAKRELQSAIDSVATMIVILSHDGTAYYANRPSREYLGVDQPVRSVRDAIHPDDRDMVDRLWREHLLSGEPFQSEQRMRRADGEYRWNFMTRVPLRDGRGNVIRWYGSGYDIHDRKVAQDALLKSQNQLAAAERELRQTLDLIPTLAWRARPDGYADYLNKRWLDYTGFSLEQALGWEWQAAIHPEDHGRLLEAWQRMLRSSHPEEVEARMRRFDGAYRWFMFRTEKLQDDAGNVVAWFGTNIDIEDRKQAEYALQRSEAYSAEAQKISMTGSVAWHIESDDHFWSDETYQIMGFPRDVRPNIEMISDRVHPDDRARFRHEIERARQGAESLDFEQRLVMPNGQVKHFRLRARRAKYASGREEVIGALMDVTEAKQSQEALDAARTALAHASRMATLGEINATIAHEINQPLASIIANAETCLRRLASEAPDLDKVRGNMEWVARDAKRAANVIQSVRGLVRKAEVHKVPLDLNAVINETKALLARELAAQQATLRSALAPRLPLVMGDRVQLQQVIINLIMNAVEAMQVVSVRPPVLLISSSHDSDRGVTVSVKDNGVGILDETRSRLFDPFFSTKPGGLGIGLSICRSIIEDHDGRLSAVNNGKEPGATFEFTLTPAPGPSS